MPTISITEYDIFVALRQVLGSFALTTLPGCTVPIVRGQVNRVPEPLSPDFVVIWPLSRIRLGTNLDTYVDSQLIGSIADNLLFVTEVIKGTVTPTCSLYGPNVATGCSILEQRSGDTGGAGVYCLTETPNISTQILYNGIHNVLQSTDFGIQCDVHGPNSGDNVQRISTLFRDYYGIYKFIQTGYGIAPLYTDDPRQMPFVNGEDQIEDRWSIDLHLQVNPVITVTQQFADELHVNRLSAIPPNS